MIDRVALEAVKRAVASQKTEKVKQQVEVDYAASGIESLTTIGQADKKSIIEGYAEIARDAEKAWSIIGGMLAADDGVLTAAQKDLIEEKKAATQDAMAGEKVNIATRCLSEMDPNSALESMLKLISADEVARIEDLKTLEEKLTATHAAIKNGLGNGAIKFSSTVVLPEQQYFIDNQKLLRKVISTFCKGDEVIGAMTEKVGKIEGLSGFIKAAKATVDACAAIVRDDGKFAKEQVDCVSALITAAKAVDANKLQENFKKQGIDGKVIKPSAVVKALLLSAKKFEHGTATNTVEMLRQSEINIASELPALKKSAAQYQWKYNDSDQKELSKLGEGVKEATDGHRLCTVADLASAYADYLVYESAGKKTERDATLTVKADGLSEALKAHLADHTTKAEEEAVANLQSFWDTEHEFKAHGATESEKMTFSTTNDIEAKIEEFAAKARKQSETGKTNMADLAKKSATHSATEEMKAAKKLQDEITTAESKKAEIEQMLESENISTEAITVAQQKDSDAADDISKAEEKVKTAKEGLLKFKKRYDAIIGLPTKDHELGNKTASTHRDILDLIGDSALLSQEEVTGLDDVAEQIIAATNVMPQSDEGVYGEDESTVTYQHLEKIYEQYADQLDVEDALAQLTVANEKLTTVQTEKASAKVELQAAVDSEMANQQNIIEGLGTRIDTLNAKLEDQKAACEKLETAGAMKIAQEACDTDKKSMDILNAFSEKLVDLKVQSKSLVDTTEALKAKANLKSALSEDQKGDSYKLSVLLAENASVPDAVKDEFAAYKQAHFDLEASKSAEQQAKSYTKDGLEKLVNASNGGFVLAASLNKQRSAKAFGPEHANLIDQIDNLKLSAKSIDAVDSALLALDSVDSKEKGKAEQLQSVKEGLLGAFTDLKNYIGKQRETISKVKDAVDFENKVKNMPAWRKLISAQFAAGLSLRWTLVASAAHAALAMPAITALLPQAAVASLATLAVNSAMTATAIMLRSGLDRERTRSLLDLRATGTRGDTLAVALGTVVPVLPLLSTVKIPAKVVALVSPAILAQLAKAVPYLIRAANAQKVKFAALGASTVWQTLKQLASTRTHLRLKTPTIDKFSAALESSVLAEAKRIEQVSEDLVLVQSIRAIFSQDSDLLDSLDSLPEVQKDALTAVMALEDSALTINSKTFTGIDIKELKSFKAVLSAVKDPKDQAELKKFGTKLSAKSLKAMQQRMSTVTAETLKSKHLEDFSSNALRKQENSDLIQTAVANATASPAA